MVAVVVIELLVNTQGMFYFAPNKIYDTQTGNSQDLIAQLNIEMPIDLSVAHKKITLEDDWIEEPKSKNVTNNYRILTRNSNLPYTDYGSYWEAMVVRKPFSDSFVVTEIA